MNVFERMVMEICALTQQDIKISREQHREFKRTVLFDILKESSYGDAFCAKFGVQDGFLYKNNNVKNCDRWIRHRYIR
jgi:hypothetical protein